MTTLVLLALCGLVAKLWFDLGALRDRLQSLENRTAPPSPVAAFETPGFAPSTLEPTPRPAARVVRSPATLPEPTQVETDLALRPVVVRVSAEPAPAFPVEQSPADSPAIDRPAVPAVRRAFGFEDVFGRKLPIWAGGFTLAVCGFLIVKYSIDAGLLSPWVRVFGGLLFGTGLIAGAEAALRNEDRVRDARVRQALSGAGIATLYASVLVAANLYGLVPPVVAFGAMALITLLAALLSIRFGAPSAVLGLVGGLAAPALVGTGAPNVPLLAGYLALAVGGLAALGRAQRWWWLGAAALVGGFGWGAILLLDGALDVADSLSIGGFLLLLGIGLPVLMFNGARGSIVRLLGTLAAAAQLAALVATGGFSLLHWSLFGLLAVTSIWLSRRERTLVDLPIPAFAVTLLLLFAWPHPVPRDFALVLAGVATIFGLPAARRAWRADGRLSDAATVAVLAASALLPRWHFPLSDATLTLLAMAGAGAASGIAAFGWRVENRREDARFVLLTATAAVLLALAAVFGLSERAVAPAWATIAAGMVLLASRAEDTRVEAFAWSAGLATTVLYALLPFDGHALQHAVGANEVGGGPVEALRWSVGVAAALAFVRFGERRGAASIGSVAAVLFGYVALAQLLPTPLLPLLSAAALAALGWSRRSAAATVTAGALSALWAAGPLAQWLAGAGGAMFGVPLFVTALPGMADTATRLLAPALAMALLRWRRPPATGAIRLAMLAAIGLLGGAAVHIAFKQLFAIDDTAAFVRLGMAERTLWQALLALGAMGLLRRAPDIARALGVAALAHLGWFTLVLHDPLWSEQAVGSLPVVNLLLPAYALGFALLWAAGRIAPPLPAIADRARGWGQIALVLLFAASELRQLVHGSVLSQGPVGQGEDIARSVLAVAVAIGLLQWGIRRRSRDWRIASLVVMLAAVLKVFLLDTSGLDGLLRIGSFAALGFSLIGIGWLYSRHVPDVEPVVDAPAVNPNAALA